MLSTGREDCMRHPHERGARTAVGGRDLGPYRFQLIYPLVLALQALRHPGICIITTCLLVPTALLRCRNSGIYWCQHGKRVGLRPQGQPIFQPHCYAKRSSKMRCIG
ncbi:hypothetical protein PsYK624_064810 [Phanerochaete sordida]|uniref:Uncharacterized protein n=1 Tax=Phanerochaete sordida TaxID=48140 RepID=A0A9P3G9D7_9APHY|nr:hypothetical protein PsYK624_064810 [Phanerochaete sordida]